MKQVYEIDEQGYYVKPVLLNPKINDVLEQIYDIPSNCIETAPQNGLYHAKWNGVEWVEGATQEEIETIKNTPKPLTELEILGQSLSEREINEIAHGQQISDLEIRLLAGGL